MRQRIDITDRVFGKLTAREDVGSKPGYGRMWRCDCECGDSIVVSAGFLLHKKRPIKSCGCAAESETVFIGARFDRLTIRGKMAKRRTHHTDWACECSCGLWTIASTGDLTSGDKSSCGCLLGSHTKDVQAKMVANKRFQKKIRQIGY